MNGYPPQSPVLGPPMPPPPAPGFEGWPQHPGFGGGFPPAPVQPPAVAAPAAGGSSTVSLPLLAGAAGVVLIALGLSLPFDSSNSWSTQTAWSVFAVLAALVSAGAALASGAASRTRWLVTAVAGGAVVGYWLLVVLPAVTGNAGFVLTLGAAAVAGGVALSPHRPR